MKRETAQLSITTPPRRALLAAAVAALLPTAARAASARRARWTYPLDEYDACLALLATGQEGDAKQAQKRLEELRPTIAYLASLDPRD